MCVRGGAGEWGGGVRRNDQDDAAEAYSSQKVKQL